MIYSVLVFPFIPLYGTGDTITMYWEYHNYFEKY